LAQAILAQGLALVHMHGTGFPGDVPAAPVSQHLSPSRYQEDAAPPGHHRVWGSWYCAASGRWGYACCKALVRSAPPCTPLVAETTATSCSDAESYLGWPGGRGSGSRGSSAEAPPAWQPRGDFETSEGFIAHATRLFAAQWRGWLRDGTLAAANPAVSEALLSEAASAEASRGVEVICERVGLREVTAEMVRHLEEFCSCLGTREYVQANKAYMDIVMGARKWQGEVPYLVEGNRNGPSVVQNVAERLNKRSSNPLDEAGIRDHAVGLRRLLTVVQAAQPNVDPSKNCG